MNCDPANLAALAKCFRGISKDMRRAIIIYLLCQWANK